MGRILIVAEKPAQAREYATALGVRGKGQGYIENERYVITWCVGHLLELEKPEVYMDLEKTGRRWGLKRLPILPGIHTFRRVVKSNTRQQFQVLQKWLRSEEIDQVICGTDADREGQLLFQEVWDLVTCNKPLSRLWISSLTTEAIREGMNHLLPEHQVAGLAAAGYGRAYSDWDFGMNLTEGFTALFGSFDPVRKKPNVISIGRVQTPTLALIVQREWEIERFVPETYYEVKATFAGAEGTYEGIWFDPAQNQDQKKLTDKTKAQYITEKIKGRYGKITNVDRKKVSEPPPLLFDLTSLSVTASKRFGYSAEKVLEIAQALYDKKAITYPRTDCAYLPEDMIQKLPAHIQAVRQEPYTQSVDEALQYGVPTNKRVINKITAHHGIIPTTEKILLQKLSEPEQKIFDLIIRRFLAVWFPAAWFEQTEILTEVEQESFVTKGRIMLSPGWKKVYEQDDMDEDKSKKKKALKAEEKAELPPLVVGENVQTKKVKIEEKSTNPPKRFTQGDLLKAMESAGKHIEDEILRQQMKGKGLGTVATRPAIIENLLERGYIRQEQKVLKPTEKGIELISLIKDKLPKASLLISPEMTGQLEYNLARVENGEITLTEYMQDVETAIINIIDELRVYEKSYGKTPLALAPGRSAKKNDKTKISEPTIQENIKQILGICPRCNGGVFEGKKGYGCSNWKEGCSFVIWKNPVCGKILTPTQIKSLLKKGKTPLIKGFKSKNNQLFSAYLVWEDADQGKVKFEFN